jgi:hypothetical protein
MASWGDLSYQSRYGKPKKLPNTNQSYVTGQPNTIAPPTPAAKPPDTGLPLDPTYQATIGGLQHKRDDALSQYAAGRPRTLADYGYTASGYDSSGAPTGLAFDPNNPFSRAALAKKTFDQSKAGTTTSYAARGQHLSGAYNRAQRNVEFGYQQSSDTLQKGLINALVGIAQGERGANTDYEIGAGQAFGDSVTRAQNTPPSPPPAAAAPAGLAGAGGNPYKPGTSEWAAFASKNGQSWKQVGGRWFRKNAAGGWTPAG